MFLHEGAKGSTRLNHQYGTYTRLSWLNLISDFRGKRGRFTGHERKATASLSARAGGSGSLNGIGQRLSPVNDLRGGENSGQEVTELGGQDDLEEDFKEDDEAHLAEWHSNGAPSPPPPAPAGETESNTQNLVSSQTSAKKRKPRQLYTEEEEVNMAKYIISRLPDVTSTFVRHCEDFAKEVMITVKSIILY